MEMAGRWISAMDVGSLFPDAYHGRTFAQGAPYEMQATGRRRIQMKRDEKRNLEQLVSLSGYTITFRYDGSDRITEAREL